MGEELCFIDIIHLNCGSLFINEKQNKTTAEIFSFNGAFLYQKCNMTVQRTALNFPRQNVSTDSPTLSLFSTEIIFRQSQSICTKPWSNFFSFTLYILEICLKVCVKVMRTSSKSLWMQVKTLLPHAGFRSPPTMYHKHCQIHFTEEMTYTDHRKTRVKNTGWNCETNMD